MSSVLVVPDILETAAADAAQIGSAVRAGNSAAVIPTTELAAAGGDEVSAAVAALFGAHAQEYQAAAARIATYHEQFVRNLSAAAASYAGTEATIATSLQGAVSGMNASHPLIYTAGEAWINSPLGRLLDLIINPPTGGAGGNEQPIVIDFVRHGQSAGNAANLIDTAVPGLPLTALRQQQANAVAGVLAPQGPFAGIYASQLTRTQQTAAPLAGMLGMTVQVLPGLNEINAGIFDGLPQVSLGGLLYLPAPLAWTLGLPLVPMLAPGAHPVNGVAFDENFNAALQTMYSNAMANPVTAANGQVTDVAFSSEFAIEVGTMMTVNNPAPLLMLTHPLPNTGIVVIQGDPQQGWTLVSWNGIPVPPASLPTRLFVDVRDVIMAPQFAAYNLLTGQPLTKT